MKTLYTNAKIFTSDPDALHAEVMLVQDGMIEFVGTAAELAQARRSGRVSLDGCARRDLKGRRVIPGLIDAHLHGLLLADYSKQISCLPPAINSIEEMIEAIRGAREGLGDPAGMPWIKGWGYDEGKLAEHRAPTRWDLDKGAADVPVFIARTCVHIAAVNSRALELAGIDRNTPDPPGGHIVRDENGEPTGILQENARNLVLDIMPKQSVREKVKDLVDLGELLLSQGIVAFTDMGNFDGGDTLDYYDAAVKEGLKQDVSIYYFWDAVRQSGAYTIGDEYQKGSRQIHVGGLKLVCDGSVSGHTAYVDEPFLGTNDRGICELPDELFEDAIAFCKANGCQLSVHAMGGRAIEKVIDRAVQEDRWTEGDLPHLRVEHVTEPGEASIAKAAANHIPFVMQPIFSYCEIESYLEGFGPERTKRAYPIRHALDSGVRVALSTDAPATSWAVPSDPWSNLKAAVTRLAYDGTDCGQDQAIGIETALQLYTRESAWVCGFHRLGQLREGYRASFAVLDRDVLSVPADEIDTVEAIETYIDGVPVYCKGRTDA